VLRKMALVWLMWRRVPSVASFNSDAYGFLQLDAIGSDPELV